MLKRIKEAYREQNLTWLWLISYSDLMTNLMLFFLMSYALTITGNLDLAAEALKRATQEFKNEPIDTQIKVMEEEIKNNATRIIVSEEGVFNSGEAEINPQAKAKLHQIAESMKGVENTIVIEGHTDNIPLKEGTAYSSNWELAAARAENVVRYFVHDEGFPPEQFAMASYGEFRPLASNQTSGGRKKNRRIELVVVKDNRPRLR